MPPKGRKKAYKMPEPLPEGEVLRDMRKKEWKLGAPLGSGGFGLIYRAAQNGPGRVEENAPCVVKIEPHENGPLFTELHFYQRAALPEKVEAWQKKHKISHLGIPKLCGGGTHESSGVRYRFLVMPRFGSDIYQKYVACNQKFPVSTVFALALQILDSLEYLHNHDYVHADIKSANLLLGFSKKDENKVFLVDFGLVHKYRPEGKHKEYKEDPRKGHNGTPEYTSIDAHKGVAPSRRGDIQILGYVMLQWLCTRLPWEDKLTDCIYIMNQKVKYSTDIPGLLKVCFKGSAYPDELKQFLSYAFKLKYDEEPDYDQLRKLCRNALKREGFKAGSPFNFGTATLMLNGDVKSPKRGRAATAKRARAQSPNKSDMEEDKSPSQPKKRKAPSQGKKARDNDPGPSGDPAVSPSKAKTAAMKKVGAKKKPASPSSANKAKGAVAKVKGATKKAAGTSTPSKKVRKRRTKAEEMTTSSTQTTPGLERRAARKGILSSFLG